MKRALFIIISLLALVALVGLLNREKSLPEEEPEIADLQREELLRLRQEATEKDLSPEEIRELQKKEIEELRR